MGSILRISEKITVKEAIGELYQFEGGNPEFRELHLPPYSAYHRMQVSIYVFRYHVP